MLEKNVLDIINIATEKGLKNVRDKDKWKYYN